MNDDERAIREVISTWMEATRRGDTSRVLSLMAEDAVFLVGGRPPMRGRQEFAAGLEALGQFDVDGTSDIQEVRVIGDWAWCWTELAVTIRENERRARFLGIPVEQHIWLSFVISCLFVALAGLALASPLVRGDGFFDLPAHRVLGVQARQRVLEDHRDVVAAQRAELLAGHRQ